MLLIKPDVIVEGLSPEMYYALGVASALKSKMFGLNCVVTALLDGHHNPNSLHSRGFAGDLRTLDLKPEESADWFAAIQRELEPLGFDVVKEKIGSTAATTQEHIHIEFQPKTGETFWHKNSL